MVIIIFLLSQSLCVPMDLMNQSPGENPIGNLLNRVQHHPLNQLTTLNQNSFIENGDLLGLLGQLGSGTDGGIGASDVNFARPTENMVYNPELDRKNICLT